MLLRTLLLHSHVPFTHSPLLSRNPALTLPPPHTFTHSTLTLSRTLHSFSSSDSPTYFRLTLTPHALTHSTLSHAPYTHSHLFTLMDPALTLTPHALTLPHSLSLSHHHTPHSHSHTSQFYALYTHSHLLTLNALHTHPHTTLRSHAPCIHSYTLYTHSYLFPLTHPTLTPTPHTHH